MTAVENPNAAYTAWIDALSARPRFGARDRRGTANFIDDAARQRGAEATRTGGCVSLARPLEIGNDENPDYAVLSVDVSVGQYEAFPNRPPFVGGHVDTGSDIAHVGAHGQRQTHLDAINHIGRGGQWYSGFAVDDPDGPSIADLANHKLFTRGVFANIPAVRGTEWVDPSEPVTGEDIDAALASGGVTFESGDALVLYMGRDRYEAAGNEMDVAGGVPTPGAGWGAARWVVDHEVSLVCWDFLDAVTANEPVFQLHMLIWAIGLLLVDNCELGAAARAVAETGTITGGLVVAPPPLPRATGSLVNPLFIQ